jgi:prephenate dehydrogenase (NADP+)
LFRSRERLTKAIDAGITDRVFRSDDLEFTVAARGWNECVNFGNFDLYERRFKEAAGELRFGAERGAEWDRRSGSVGAASGCAPARTRRMSHGNSRRLIAAVPWCCDARGGDLIT